MSIIRSILIAMGVLWLPIEAYEGLNNTNLMLPFYCFLILSLIAGIIFFVVDGYFLAGFFKSRVEITGNGFDTKIFIKFDDLFSQDGWKAIGANDFFDSIVDDDLVSSKSLHGHVINTYWSNKREEWQNQIDTSLAKAPKTEVERNKGNLKRYPIGTTAIATTDNQKMLFVALGETDTGNNVTKATAESLICALRGLLQKAREVCANDPLYIPLMGSGLGRVGIKNAILVDLILVAIVEETKQSKITNAITIILPIEKKPEINLGNFSRDWN
tara:strand:- start:1471 stop:2286 length:816 start_codon:yes stop_codon:yes gene_type:complete